MPCACAVNRSVSRYVSVAGNSQPVFLAAALLNNGKADESEKIMGLWCLCIGR